jgi:hypothetical protein
VELVLVLWLGIYGQRAGAWRRGGVRDIGLSKKVQGLSEALLGGLGGEGGKMELG